MNDTSTIKQTGIVLGLLAMLLGACETTLDVNFPDQSPRITVNSFFRPGADWEIHLSEARSLADGRDAIRAIENATAEILEDGEVLTALSNAGGGLYRSSRHQPRADKTYTLRVSAPGYEHIEAIDTVPALLPVEFAYETAFYDTSAVDVDVSIHLTDPPAENNYYRLFVHAQYRDEATRELFTYTHAFQTDDEAILAEDHDPYEIEENNTLSDAVFSDALFDGEPHIISLHLRPALKIIIPVAGMSQARRLTRIQLYLYSLSPAYYGYATTYDLHEEVRDNPFAEPVRVYTNVQNGFGIFAGFTRYRLNVAMN